VVVHVVEGLEQVISVKVIIISGESDETGCTVISEVDKDVVLGSGLEDLLATNSSGIASEDSEEISGVDISSLIIDLDASINILSFLQKRRLVENLAGEGVFRVIGDIIVSHSDDVFRGKSVSLQDLISMEDISLMSVVVVIVGTSNEDGIVGSLNASHGDAEESKS
jgi:hypothetical protein